MSHSSAFTLPFVFDLLALSFLVVCAVGVYAMLGSGQVAQAVPAVFQRLPAWWLLSPQHRLLPSLQYTEPLRQPKGYKGTPQVAQQHSALRLAAVVGGVKQREASPFVTQAHWHTAWSHSELYPWQTPVNNELAEASQPQRYASVPCYT